MPVGKYVDDVDNHGTVGKVLDYDGVAGWVDLSMKASTEPIVPRGFKPQGPLVDKVLRESIAATGRGVLEGSPAWPPGSSSASSRAGRPGSGGGRGARRRGGPDRPRPHRPGAGRAGTPGTGKTYAAARLIRSLLDAGKKVGVTALSHAVIRHVLDEVGRPALHKGRPEDVDDGSEQSSAATAGRRR